MSNFTNIVEMKKFNNSTTSLSQISVDQINAVIDDKKESKQGSNGKEKSNKNDKNSKNKKSKHSKHKKDKIKFKLNLKEKIIQHKKALMIVGGVTVGLVVLAATIAGFAVFFQSKIKKTYQWKCAYDDECNSTQLLICPTINGTCNCTVQSYAYHCDCPTGYFWDNKTSICTLKKTFNESCQYQCQCKDNVNISCSNGICDCTSSLNYWNGNSCVPKLPVNSNCTSTYSCEKTPFVLTCINNNCSCPSTHYPTATTCLPKESYQVPCDQYILCDDNVGLECPQVNGTCNCPVLSVASLCDCTNGTYFDNTTMACEKRKNYGDSCIYDFECVPNVNLVCLNSTCDCTYGQRWNGAQCDSSLLLFYQTAQRQYTVSTYGTSYTFGDPRSVSAAKHTYSYYNYVMDAVAGRLVLFDEDWNFAYHVNISAPRFMVSADQNIYLSTDKGLMKMDLNHKILIQLNSSNIYRRVYYNKSEDLLYASDVINHKIDTFDRNLNKLNTLDVKALGYQMTPGSIMGFNKELYVGTLSNEILVIVNNTIVRKYSKVCVNSTSPVNSLYFDNYGNMAVSCTADRASYLYNVNGTYLQLILKTTCQPNYIAFDSKGRLVACGSNTAGVDVFY